ncbi:G-type lectin S-receptor-like serine/threonine-protein kinase SD2-5 isoform X1 [Malania oleifera]|nr:G-type lectin S-receptor-like serine/threonine-protein kinase SD2-5 isoform X1 [Malania oleifera]
MGVLHSVRSLCFFLLLVFNTCSASVQIGQIHPGFTGSQMDYNNTCGLFLQSSNSTFALGFFPALDIGSFVLVVLHVQRNRPVWTANRGSLVRNSDKFVFDKNGNVYLENNDGKAWSTHTEGKGATAMELRDTGNLVLLDNNRKILWQSFSHPTDTLLPDQFLLEGMQLRSFPKHSNLFHFLEIKSGDMILSAGYQTPQIYWSMANDSRKKILKEASGKRISSASLVSNSWDFYDQNGVRVWQFVFSEESDTNAIWAAILGADGSISFLNLQNGKWGGAESAKIPHNPCGIPESCQPYEVCSFENRCQCPSPLFSNFMCKPPRLNSSTCNSSEVDFLFVGEELNYFALDFVSPFSKTDLNGCKEACQRNCSCVVLFFESSLGSCYLFDQIGSLQRADQGAAGFTSYVKVLKSGGESLNPTRKKTKAVQMRNIIIVVIAVVTTLVILGLTYLGLWYPQKKKRLLESTKDNLEEDDLFDSISGMLNRYSFDDLCNVTKNFSTKLGQGGFGSVYKGLLPDGTQVAVKKLEGIGQGKKEFRAEVSIIGNVHHVHLVRLRGFCAEGACRLLVYEYMGKGSLDRWIFNNNKEGLMLDWEMRFSIALGTAKGLAYLHEECDVKIVHCDIKPENVLLDDNYLAKVSDFGLAKLMNREQSLAFTTLRGTRGYLAPEWITNHAISEKSDVYSFGMLLLEIIGGRKNYEPRESSEREYFPSYVFKMMEEGELNKVLDSKLKSDENDERINAAIKVALWCIQDDMNARPPMTKVVQMLEGLCAVPQPPTTSQKGSHICSGLFQLCGEKGTPLQPINYNSDVLLSDVQLSGPR